MRQLNLFLKRLGDILLSLLGMIILTIIPVFIIIPILIKLDSKGPVLFRQIRVGKDGKLFTMYKFRSMSSEIYDAEGNEIMPEKRITKLGRFLRKSSLDEVPQLFNIFKGDMSIIGPRPMLDYQIGRCTKEELQRFQMRPGVTGWAQVKGRNNIQWPQRIVYDIEYIKNFSVLFDVKVLFMTVLYVLKGTGTDVAVRYRGVDRFSKSYKGEIEKEENLNE